MTNHMKMHHRIQSFVLERKWGGSSKGKENLIEKQLIIEVKL